MNLRHRRADAPQGAHRPPQAHELLLDLVQPGRDVHLWSFHNFCSLQESLKAILNGRPRPLPARDVAPADSAAPSVLTALAGPTYLWATPDSVETSHAPRAYASGTFGGLVTRRTAA